MIQQFHFCVYIQREWKQDFDKIPALQCNVYYSFIHNSQDMKTTQMPMNRWMDKKDVVHIHSGFHCHKKGRYPAICNNMDGPWVHYAKWDKSDRERQILYIITYMRNPPKNQSYKKQRVRWWLPGDWCGSGGSDGV